MKVIALIVALFAIASAAMEEDRDEKYLGYRHHGLGLYDPMYNDYDHHTWGGVYNHHQRYQPAYSYGYGHHSRYLREAEVEAKDPKEGAPRDGKYLPYYSSGLYSSPYLYSGLRTHSYSSYLPYSSYSGLRYLRDSDRDEKYLGYYGGLYNNYYGMRYPSYYSTPFRYFREAGEEEKMLAAKDTPIKDMSKEKETEVVKKP